MLFASLFHRLTAGRAPGQSTPLGQASRGRRRAAEPRQFLPRLQVLEDRSLPSVSPMPLVNFSPDTQTVAASQQRIPFKERLTVVSVSETGVIHYTGQATHFGQLTARLNPDNTFVKVAANGDTAFGFVTQATPVTGTITITGGTGRFEGTTGTSSYVITTDPVTGVITVDVNGTITNGRPPVVGSVNASGQQVIPFKVSGGGTAPLGLPLQLNFPAPHNATGTATHVGRYSGAAMFQLLSFTSPTTGTFNSAIPFPFTAVNGDKLVFHYGRPEFGASTPGTFALFDAGNGKVFAVFVAEFTPVPSAHTGRFKDVIGGNFVMVATTAPFVLGSTTPTPYTWEGSGTIIRANGAGRAAASSSGGTGAIGRGVVATKPDVLAKNVSASSSRQTIPFKVTGGGTAPQGLPVQLNVPAPHNATGTATQLGRYSGQGMVQLLSFTSPTTGTFSSPAPFVFTAANGDKLAFHYGRPDFGASGPGTFTIQDAGNGKVIVVFVAEFTPVPSASTGRFKDVTGGSFVMVATSAPFVLGSTDPAPYTWQGEGKLEIEKRK